MVNHTHHQPPIIESRYVRILLRCRQEMQLPPWKASALRGVFGHGLRAVASGMPPPPWPGCQSGTLADAVFEPQRAWQDSQATQPWSLHCLELGTHYQAGDLVEMGITLFGTWPDWCVDCLRQSLEAGLSRGLGSERAILELAAFQEVLAAPENVPAPATAVHLRTLSPCHLQDHRTACGRLNAPAIARSLLRRSRQLHRQLIGGDGIDEAAYRSLRNQADNLETVTERSQRITQNRRSSRQGAHSLAGLEGELVIAGDDFHTWSPLFAQAPQLLIGNKPSFGFGNVALRWLDENELSDIRLGCTRHDQRGASA